MTDKAILVKVKSNNYFKFHYDHGILESGKNKWNFYGSLNGTKTLENLNIRFGAHLINDRYQSDNRLKIEPGSANNYQLTWYNRSVAERGKWRYGMLGAFKLNNQCLIKNNVFVGYQFDRKTSAFVRCENNGYRKNPEDLTSWMNIFDSIYFDLISSYRDPLKYGIEVKNI